MKQDYFDRFFDAAQLVIWFLGREPEFAALLASAMVVFVVGAWVTLRHIFHGLVFFARMVWHMVKPSPKISSKPDNGSVGDVCSNIWPRCFKTINDVIACEDLETPCLVTIGAEFEVYYAKIDPDTKKLVLFKVSDEVYEKTIDEKHP